MCGDYNQQCWLEARLEPSLGGSKAFQPSCLPSPRFLTCMQSSQVRCPSLAISPMTAKGPHALPYRTEYAGKFPSESVYLFQWHFSTMSQVSEELHLYTGRIP